MKKPLLPDVWTSPFGYEIMTELKMEAAKRFRLHSLPETKAEWEQRRPVVRQALLEKIHVEVDHELPLNAEWSKNKKHEGCSTRQVVFQSRPGIYVTATLYVPDGDGPFPAVIYMHGHNKEGRLLQSNQAHGFMFARSGYVVLMVDAFGSGERSTLHGEFEYHGGLIGGLLLNLGETLMGCQISDNMRAVDLLASLPFVDADRMGATGASGGGNQTMYLTAFDERIKAGVPVVSVGSYQSYVGGANCICELITDGLDTCEESFLLALVAPRAIMPCNALHDINPTFYVSEMMRSVSEAKKVFRALNCENNLRTVAFNGPHSYPEEVESAALGFFNFHLKGIEHGLPAPTPLESSLEMAEVMFYPKGQRPADKIFSPAAWISRRGRELADQAAGTPSELAEILRIQPESITAANGYPAPDGWEKYTLETTRGRILPFLFRRGSGNICRILAAPGGKKELLDAKYTEETLASGNSLLVFDPWGCGESGNLPEFTNILYEQHCLSRSLMWLGRRLMGEWTMDFLRALEFVKGKLPDAQLQLFGMRDSGIAALYASILSNIPVQKVITMNAPASYIRKCDEPNPFFNRIQGLDYCPGEYFTMAIALPGILRWGDIPYAVKLSSSEVEMIASRHICGTIMEVGKK